MTRISVLSALVVGIVASLGFYELFWDFCASRGLAIPLKLLTVASFSLGLTPSLFFGPRLSKHVIGLRREAWLSEIAGKNGLDRAELEEMTRSFSGG